MGSTSAGSAGCGKAASNQHGAMGSDKAGPVVIYSSADCEPLALEPPPSNAEMFVTCNCNCSCPPSSPAALSVSSPSCVRHWALCVVISYPSVSGMLLKNAPITIRQLRICFLVAVRMAARCFKCSNQSLARVQAQVVASALPPKNVLHYLFGHLQCLLQLFFADIFDSHA